MPTQITEKDVKDAIKTILLDKESYETTLFYALKFARKALKQEGEEFKETCRYLIGNLIFWTGLRQSKIKSVIRKYSFNHLTHSKNCEEDEE